MANDDLTTKEFDNLIDKISKIVELYPKQATEFIDKTLKTSSKKLEDLAKSELNKDIAINIRDIQADKDEICSMLFNNSPDFIKMENGYKNDNGSFTPGKHIFEKNKTRNKK